MRNTVVRIERVIIENLKNVEHGEISFSNSRRPDGASVLGLYGQNGSGKSTLVDTLEMIQQIVSGRGLSKRTANLVNVDADYAQVECEFLINRKDKGEKYTVIYGFKAKSDQDEPLESMDSDIDDSQEQTMGVFDDEPQKNSMRIFDEVLKVRIDGPERRMRLTTFIDTSDGTPFGVSAKRKALIGSDSEIAIELAVEMRVAYRESRSFVFSGALHKAIRDKWIEDGKKEGTTAETMLMVSTFLRRFCRTDFFVLNTRDSGMPAIGALPFPFRYDTEEGRIVGGTMLPIEGTSVIPQKLYDIVTPAISNTNIVLQQLVPGLTIDIEVLGEKLTEDGGRGKSVQLVSKRNGRIIPLSSESEGIKRIISFLNLIILMYNDPTVTVVIDEIDAGVFEYLLGELLGIVSEHGMGQIIFTSHNLRPLETLDRGFIAFTTTNPKNRYWRMTNVKPSNNLRDFYYRDIMLGGQDEPLYDPTSNGEIEFALMEAGATVD